MRFLKYIQDSDIDMGLLIIGIPLAVIIPTVAFHLSTRILIVSFVAWIIAYGLYVALYNKIYDFLHRR